MRQITKISKFQLQTFALDNWTLGAMWDITRLYNSHCVSNTGLGYIKL